MGLILKECLLAPPLTPSLGREHTAKGRAHLGSRVIEETEQIRSCFPSLRRAAGCGKRLEWAVVDFPLSLLHCIAVWR